MLFDTNRVEVTGYGFAKCNFFIEPRMFDATADASVFVVHGVCASSVFVHGRPDRAVFWKKLRRPILFQKRHTFRLEVVVYFIINIGQFGFFFMLQWGAKVAFNTAYTFASIDIADEIILIDVAFYDDIVYHDHARKILVFYLCASMSYLLHIETATDICSVALSQQGICLEERRTSEARSHISKLSLLIDELLKRHELSYDALAGIAVSSGPGSYTGLRVGYATAKGLCFALGIPLIEVDTLQAIAWGMKSTHPNADCYVAMIDARRMEVYTNRFDQDNRPLATAEAVVLTDAYFLALKESYQKIVIGGSGAFKVDEFIEQEKDQFVISSVLCDAQNMIAIAHDRLEQQVLADVAYCEPRYLKPPNITVSKKKLFPT